MMRIAAVVALWMIGDASRVRADAVDDALPAPATVPTARPVIAVEDTRSHGPTAHNWIDLAVAPTLLVGRAGSMFQLTTQLAIVLPRASRRELREIYRAYRLDDYALRVRSELFWGSDAPAGGPVTLAVQRYFPIAPLAISPLLYAHFGIEAALATPWLSGRFVTPHPTIQILDGVDSELASDGWSLRPVSSYLRGDFLACRSLSGEVGFEPEAFVPATGANEYGTRVHVAAGWSLGCLGNMSPHAPKIALEYRGRVVMYAAGQAPAYRDSIGAALQIDLAWFAVQLFYRSDLGSAMTHHGAIGVRFHVGRDRGGP